MLMYTGKKSQLEVVGLVIIVLLVSIALLFFLQFSLKKEPEIKKTYTTAQMTSNMVNALLKTTTGCNDNTIQTLLADCALDYANDYTTGYNIHCDTAEDKPPDSCVVVNKRIGELLEDTLGLWNKKYQLSAFLLSNPSDKLLDYNNKLAGCTGNIESESYPVPTGWAGLLLFKLDVCME